jgi:hypothetical protein
MGRGRQGGSRFERSSLTPMGTMPISVIWAGVPYPLGERAAGTPAAAPEAGVRRVKPRAWPTVLLPSAGRAQAKAGCALPASRTWRTVCGLRCKEVSGGGRGGAVPRAAPPGTRGQVTWHTALCCCFLDSLNFALSST